MRSARLWSSLDPDTFDPLHDESVIAVREELNFVPILPRDVTDDSQHVTFHVPLTPETKNPSNEDLVMKMQKGVTLINTVCLEGCTRQSRDA